MSRQLEMLEADLREVLAHLVAFPGDPYAHGRLASIQAAIEAATPPAMSHQRQRADLNTKPKSICTVCKDKSDCMKCPFALMPFVKEDKGLSSADALELLETKAKDTTDGWDFGRINMVRFTFGEDPDMDERWIAAERTKAKGVRGDQRTVPQPTPAAEPDKYGFPAMAYDLTGFRNLNYGTRNY